MKCPVCTDTVLTISERQGIEIDFCPKCRGVWLDRGELDKIIQRADNYAGENARSVQPQAQPRYQPQQMKPDDSHYGYQHQPSHHHQPHHKKRGGFWSELFD